MFRRLSLVVFLLLWGCARAEEPRVAIERGIKAMGLDPDPTRRPAMAMTVEFSGWWSGTGYFCYQPPRKQRWDIVLRQGRDGPLQSLTVVFDGHEGWAVKDGQILKGSKKAVYARVGEAQLLEVFSLPLLFADIEGRFKVAEESRVLQSGLQDGLAYGLSFDEKTGVLAAGGVILPEPHRRPGAQFSNYRESRPADGAKILRRAGITPEDALAFLRKQAADPEKVLRARALVRQLGDECFERREKASAELLELGANARGALRVALRDKDREIIRRAHECLQRISRVHPDEVMVAAIRQVEVQRLDEGVEALLALLPAASEVTHREAVAALLVLSRNGHNLNPVLWRAQKSSDPIIRDAALAALGHDGGDFLKLPGRRITLSGVKLPAMATVHLAHGHLSCEVTSVDFFNAFDPKLFVEP
jgi:hypothetical protein